MNSEKHIDVELFRSDEFGNIRAYADDNHEVWFVLTDINHLFKFDGVQYKLKQRKRGKKQTIRLNRYTTQNNLRIVINYDCLCELIKYPNDVNVIDFLHWVNNTIRAHFNVNISKEETNMETKAQNESVKDMTISTEKFSKFNNDIFGELTVIEFTNGELWFIADEVCKKLKIKNTPDALSRLDEDEKNTIVLNYSINIKQSAGNPNRAIINESGLYSLTLSARKDDAKAFKRWVTHEVIPSIRKTGSYSLRSKETATDIIDKELIVSKINAMLPLIDSIAPILQQINDIADNGWRNLTKTSRVTENTHVRAVEDCQIITDTIDRLTHDDYVSQFSLRGEFNQILYTINNLKLTVASDAKSVMENYYPVITTFVRTLTETLSELTLLMNQLKEIINNSHKDNDNYKLLESKYNKLLSQLESMSATYKLTYDSQGLLTTVV